MKKINPKVTTIVVMLLSLLVAGGITLDEVIGETSNSDGGASPIDTSLF